MEALQHNLRNAAAVHEAPPSGPLCLKSCVDRIEAIRVFGTSAGVVWRWLQSYCGTYEWSFAPQAVIIARRNSTRRSGDPLSREPPYASPVVPTFCQASDLDQEQHCSK